MKQETKELVEWLKDHLSHYRNQLAAGQIKIGLVAGEKEEKNAYAAINFLNSLEDIELHLCLGGYIRDREGTPCCHGDEVIYTRTPVAIRGMLHWHQNVGAFHIHYGHGDEIHVFSTSEIVKVD